MIDTRRIPWMLEAVIDKFEKLTEWEESFIRNAEEKLRKNVEFTEPMYNKLSQIYERLTQ